MEAGVSEQINFSTINTTELKQKLLRILTEPSYALNMALRSQRFRDQPQKPLDRAIWWIEYLIRSPDASHLRVPINELGFISANCLDLYATFLAIVVCAISLVALVLRRIIRMFSSSKSVEKIKDN